MRRLAVIVIFAALLVGVVLRAQGTGDSGLRIERVFGPEVPTGRYKHPASMTELRNGDLYLVYYGGDGEYAPGTAVFGARLKKGSTIWPAPKAIARDPFRSLGNAVVWQAPDEVVWLFYVVRFGDTWSTSRIQAKISRDNAETWSDVFMISLDEGMMVRNRGWRDLAGQAQHARVCAGYDLGDQPFRPRAQSMGSRAGAPVVRQVVPGPPSPRVSASGPWGPTPEDRSGSPRHAAESSD